MQVSASDGSDRRRPLACFPQAFGPKLCEPRIQRLPRGDPVEEQANRLAAAVLSYPGCDPANLRAFFFLHEPIAGGKRPTEKDTVTGIEEGKRNHAHGGKHAVAPAQLRRYRQCPHTVFFSFASQVPRVLIGNDQKMVLPVRRALPAHPLLRHLVHGYRFQRAAGFADHGEHGFMRVEDVQELLPKHPVKVVDHMEPPPCACRQLGVTGKGIPQSFRPQGRSAHAQYHHGSKRVQPRSDRFKITGQLADEIQAIKRQRLNAGIPYEVFAAFAIKLLVQRQFNHGSILLNDCVFAEAAADRKGMAEAERTLLFIQGPYLRNGFIFYLMLFVIHWRISQAFNGAGQVQQALYCSSLFPFA